MATFYKRSVNDTDEYYHCDSGVCEKVTVSYDEEDNFRNALLEINIPESEISSICNSIDDNDYMSECGDQIADYVSRIGGRPTRPGA